MAENKRQTLLSEATNATSDWRTELQLSIISDEDKARPSDWMIYIKAVDVLQVKDEETFDKIEWPLKPEE
ncbi:tail fiber assembly protein [Pantoea deleyi]|uniref:tail fiber assembly protein n=1 Tax=Pantoea deleyi TaxID=470932 RepID=UPI0035D4B1DB